MANKSEQQDTFKVYALSDPRTPLEKKYIGMTKKLPARFSSHLNNPHSKEMREWITRLKVLGLRPCCIVIEEFATYEAAARRESELIASTEGLFNTRNTKCIDVEDLGESEFETLATVERRHILKILEQCSWNKLDAARILGIGRQTLYNKLALYERNKTVWT